MKTNRFLIIIGLVLCLGFGLLAVLSVLVINSPHVSEDRVTTADERYIYQAVPTPGTELTNLEMNAEIRIPTSAREIYGLIASNNQLDTWVRLELPDAELASFMEEALCTGALTRINPKTHKSTAHDPEWWQPQHALDLEECSDVDDYIYQRILVDRSTPENVTIYVFSISQR